MRLRKSRVVWVVYALLDPRDSLPHYIGRTWDGSYRIPHHWSCRHIRNSGKAKTAWLRELDAQGVGPPESIILERYTTQRRAAAGEDAWIERGRAEGWPLTNAPRKTSGLGKIPIAIRDAREHRKMVRQAKRDKRKRFVCWISNDDDWFISWDAGKYFYADGEHAISDIIFKAGMRALRAEVAKRAQRRLAAAQVSQQTQLLNVR